MNNEPTYYNPQWDKELPIDQALYNTIKEHGFDYWHTGGGCMAWAKDIEGGYIMLSYFDTLGSDKEALDPEWIIGRYTEDNEWFSVAGITLAQGLEISPLLPIPSAKEPETIMTFKEFINKFTT